MDRQTQLERGLLPAVPNGHTHTHTHAHSCTCTLMLFLSNACRHIYTHIMRVNKEHVGRRGYVDVFVHNSYDAFEKYSDPLSFSTSYVTVLF